MKTLYLMLALMLLVVLPASGQYPEVSLRQIQEVPLDSLLIADSVQGTPFSRISLQASPYWGDTVTITALVVVPAKILTFTAGGWTMLLYDTSQSSPWGAIFVRVNAPADTPSLNPQFLIPQRGHIVRMTGVISEFPSTANLMNSTTQFQPLPGDPVQIVGTGEIPAAIPKTVGDFHHGIFPAPGRPVRYSTGEPFESLIVELTDLIVDNRVNFARGTFSAVDAAGNQITMYDASRYFTKGHGGTLPYPGDPDWIHTYDTRILVGTRIDTLRGYITTVSGGDNPRGYRIAPIWPGDVVIGITLPSITQHRRNPIVVPPDSAARISVRVTRQPGGFPLGPVQLHYSLSHGPFTSVPMQLQPDTTYTAVIPQQPANTFVKYYITADDSLGNRSILASSALGGVGSDTSRGFFFYTVLNRPLTIRDIQYTPFSNGRTAYLGALVSVSGVVTADTAHIRPAPLTTGGTSSWYMQTGNAPWNGIWFVGTFDSLEHLRNGDSITVTGVVAENFDVTRIQAIINRPTVHATGLTEPAPVVLTTGTFGPTVGNGTPSAEMWEGMLVRFNNVAVTDTFPVFADRTEFAISDGSGEILVRRDGRHNYSNVAGDPGTIWVPQGSQIEYVQGIVYFSFNRYKIVPRRASDFGTITKVGDPAPGILPETFALSQNYPNPFNPITAIQYDIPSAMMVTLKIYNILGQEVATLVNGEQVAGRYTIHFDASHVASGVYFYRLTAGHFVSTKKMMVMK